MRQRTLMMIERDLDDLELERLYDELNIDLSTIERPASPYLFPSRFLLVNPSQFVFTPVKRAVPDARLAKKIRAYLRSKNMPVKRRRVGRKVPVYSPPEYVFYDSNREILREYDSDE